jgi:integrase
MSARPFSEAEYAQLVAYFTARRDTRNKLLLVLGCGTGFRIQELASITVGHAWTGSEVAREITLARRVLKGGAGVHRRSIRSRRVPLSESVRAAIAEHLAVIGTGDPNRCLLSSNRANAGGLDRGQAYKALIRACEACGINADRISTHSCRKLFAKRMFLASGKSIWITSKLLGHRSVNTTAFYLEADSEELDRLVLTAAA